MNDKIEKYSEKFHYLLPGMSDMPLDTVKLEIPEMDRIEEKESLSIIIEREITEKEGFIIENPPPMTDITPPEPLGLPPSPGCIN